MSKLFVSRVRRPSRFVCSTEAILTQKALLALADGSLFWGDSIGVSGETVELDGAVKGLHTVDVILNQVTQR